VKKKPWGQEYLWAKTPHYAAKLLFIKGGHRLSLQYHRQKIETVLVLEGTLLAEIGRKNKELVPGEYLHIPAGVLHRFAASSSGPLMWGCVLAEVSTNKLGDIVRLEDDYGRKF
jgi:quercetin dioxygenase-like cupin family protein